MSYQQTLFDNANDPEQLELAYLQATRSGEQQAFAEAVFSGYEANPGNLLFAAWYYRLAYSVEVIKGRVIAWVWAIPIAILNGLLFWVLSDVMVQTRGQDFLPMLVIVWSPISALLVMAFLALAGKALWRRLLLLGLALALLTVYVLQAYELFVPRFYQQQYLNLAVIHLPILAWAAMGLYVLWGRADAENRFAFLIKSLEVFVMAGLFAIAGGLFTAITFALFQALGIEPPELILRLFIAGGAGLIPVLAVAMIYDPDEEPARQSFDDGLSKLIASLLRLMLPLALLVLVVYLAFIPFNFRQPFENRDVLIIFNAMLFAVIALLAGATPVSSATMDENMQKWLRRGIMAVAALALIISLYAFAAIVYRTAIDKLTPNRLTFIGWNLINIGVLVWLLVKQARAGFGRWLGAMHSTFAVAMLPYVIWSLLVIAALPWMFGIDRSEVENLPPSIQEIVYERPYPILLQCPGSPHIYLLEDGEKRWVKDIPTFTAQGFEWYQVQRVGCDALNALPDGLPIPPDAGQPPE